MMRKPKSRELAALVVLFLLLITLATARPAKPALYPPKAGDAQAIFLVDNGFHSDLVIPRAAIVAHGGPIAAAAARTGGDPWVMVGWGDARFYEATSPWEGRWLDGLRAGVGGRPTVVHLEGVWGRPDLVWKSRLHRIALSSAGLAALLARADRAFALGPDGAPQFVPEPRDPNEAFFRSGEAFSLLHLCNQWTAELLNAAGLPTTPALDTLPAGLLLDLHLRAGL
jgi:uncharacterized protein (TIGR02117 family)